MDDWLYPDNIPRIQRVHTLLAQTDNYSILTVRDSQQIQAYYQKSNRVIQQYFDSLEKLPIFNQADLVLKVDELKKKIIELQQKIQEYNSIEQDIGFFITQSLAKTIKNALVNKTNKFIENSIKSAYISRYTKKFPESYPAKIMLGEFNIKFPKWIKVQAFSFASTAMFEVGFDLVFGAIVGAFQREQAREQIKLALDARFYAMKAYLINHEIIKQIIHLIGLFEGGKAQIDAISILLNSGLQEDAYEVLSNNKFIGTLDSFYTNTSNKISDQKVVGELKKLDEYAGYIEQEVQPNWQPPAQ